MKVNSEMFQCIMFGNVEDSGEFVIDSHPIAPENCVTLLRLYFDNKFKVS